jgi:peroxidase
MHTAMALILSMIMASLTMTTFHVSAAAQPTPGSALSPTYYDGLCPNRSYGTKQFQATANTVVTAMVRLDPTLMPALTRMCFHEGFVEGAEGSILLDYNSSYPTPEKDGIPNNGSLRGYEVIDAVKSAVERVCPGVISCADILQESVRVALASALNGTALYYSIRYGRRDGNVSLASESLTNLPPPFFNYAQLKANFASKNFNTTELVILSGAHTFGVTHCSSFTQRLYNFSGNGSGTDPAMDPVYAQSLKIECPQNCTTDNIVPMDVVKPVITCPTFDNQYFKNIQAGKVPFTSDNALIVNDSSTVNVYAADNNKFRNDFIQAIVKLSELQVKLYPVGQIRSNCRKRN